jgi:hypothetical protein
MLHSPDTKKRMRNPGFRDKNVKISAEKGVARRKKKAAWAKQ